MLKFDCLEKGLGIVSPPHFVYDFSRKIFIILYSFLTDQILWSDCLYFMKYWEMCVLQLFFNQVVTP